jgi:phage-related holin
VKSFILNNSKALLITLLALFAPTKQAVLTAIGLCALDFITGILASKKQAIPITSNGIKKTIIKLVVYLMAILLAFVTQQYLTGPMLPVMTFVTSMVGLTELTSILENVNIVAGGSLLSAIISSLQKNTTNNQ